MHLTLRFNFRDAATGRIVHRVINRQTRDQLEALKAFLKHNNGALLAVTAY